MSQWDSLLDAFLKAASYLQYIEAILAGSGSRMHGKTNKMRCFLGLKKSQKLQQKQLLDLTPP